MNSMSDDLTIIDHTGFVTAIRGRERMTVPLWVAELVNCGFTGDRERMDELWRQHMKGPAETQRVVDFARLVTGLSHAEISEAIHGVLDRHTH